MTKAIKQMRQLKKMKHYIYYRSLRRLDSFIIHWRESEAGRFMQSCDILIYAMVFMRLKLKAVLNGPWKNVVQNGTN